MSEDPIALLLPDVSDEERQDARRMTTFLRLLSSDARGEASGSAQVVLARAREDLEADRKARLALALEELLRAHLEHGLGRDEYCWFGESKLDALEAWSRVADLRAECPWLPAVPRPGEAALSVAERVFAALERLLGKNSRTELWRARMCVVNDGAEAGRVSLQALAEARGMSANSLQPELVAGVAECFLSRGAVREAGAWLASQQDLFCKSPRLSQLCSWVTILLGERTKGVRGAGPLPAALCELRERAPELAACLPGVSGSRERGDRWRSFSERLTVVHRDGLGASVLAVFAFRDGLALPICVETAPALNYGVPKWLEERADACTDPSDPQHALVVEVGSRLMSAGDCESAALGGAATRCLALEPILDEEGEVCGWLHLEFEHLAIPSRRGLRELAADWRDKLLNWSPLAEAGPLGARDRDVAPSFSAAREAAFALLLGSVGLKLKRRRWWGFDLEEGTPRLVAQEGEGLSPAGLCAGQGRALRRSISTSGVVRFDEARVGLAVHPMAASGVVLPIRGLGCVLGCLVVESKRRNDFATGDVERLAQLVPACSTRFRVARFSDWHAARFGVGICLPAESPGFVQFAARVAQVATAAAPLSIVGPAGSGKRVVARWVAFEGGGDCPVEFSCAGRDDTERLTRCLEQAAGGSLLVNDLDRATPRLQQELLALLSRERGRERPCRVLSTSRKPLAELVARGQLRDDLALALERVKLKLPALRDRREDLSELVQFLTIQIACEESKPVPELDEAVLALLWRQSWPGNVRELEGVLTRLVLGQEGRRVELALALSALDTPLKRVPSRRPSRSDLLAALRTTRTLGGRFNKTRAAAYLGWDPDTLVARMGDAALGEQDLPESESWREE